MTVQKSGSTLVATMAGGPQVVTFALDALLRRGEHIREVVAVHLSPQADPLLKQGIAKLTAEFPDDLYNGQPCRLRFYPIREGNRRLDDIRDDADVNVAWDAVYDLISSLKSRGRHLHVCVSGGRRMLALLAVSAAMLHFDHDDRLWHMYTPRDFLERARDGAIMHARPADGVRLLQVPLIPWGAYVPGLRALAQASPMEIVAAQTRWLDGLSPQEVAETLCVTVKTVHAHKTVVLSECRIAWGLPDDARLGYHFLREKFRRFFQDLNV
jgi:CRISPR-associated protein Csx14